jgi:hypothetical protein
MKESALFIGAMFGAVGSLGMATYDKGTAMYNIAAGLTATGCAAGILAALLS